MTCAPLHNARFRANAKLELSILAWHAASLRSSYIFHLINEELRLQWHLRKIPHALNTKWLKTAIPVNDPSKEALMAMISESRQPLEDDRYWRQLMTGKNFQDGCRNRRGMEQASGLDGILPK
jgi:hypothetical protein